MKRLWAVLLSLSASGSAFAAADPPPLRIVTRELPPFFYRVDAKPTGIEHDILAYYAKTSGRRLEVLWMKDWESVLPALAQGRADVAAARVSITTERHQQFDFSSPYLLVRLMLVEPRDQSTTALEQLRGAALATLRGSTYEALLSRVPEANLLYADDIEGALGLVASGKARAAAIDSFLALQLLPRFPKLRLSMPLADQQAYGFAVRKGSGLEIELSNTIRQLKASQIYFRILETHLGKDAAAMVRAAQR